MSDFIDPDRVAVLPEGEALPLHASEHAGLAPGVLVCRTRRGGLRVVIAGEGTPGAVESALLRALAAVRHARGNTRLAS